MNRTKPPAGPDPLPAIYYPEPLRRERGFYHGAEAVVWLGYILPGIFFLAAFLLSLPVVDYTGQSWLGIYWPCVGYGVAGGVWWLNLAHASKQGAQLFYLLVLWQRSLLRRQLRFELQCLNWWPYPTALSFTWDRRPEAQQAHASEASKWFDEVRQEAAQLNVPAAEYCAFVETRRLMSLGLPVAPTWSPPSEPNASSA